LMRLRSSTFFPPRRRPGSTPAMDPGLRRDGALVVGSCRPSGPNFSCHTGEGRYPGFNDTGAETWVPACAGTTIKELNQEHVLICHAGGGRYPPQTWIPTFVGMTG